MRIGSICCIAPSEWLGEEDWVPQHPLLSYLHSVVIAPVFVAVKIILMVEMLSDAVLQIGACQFFHLSIFFCLFI